MSCLKYVKSSYIRRGRTCCNDMPRLLAVVLRLVFAVLDVFGHGVVGDIGPVDYPHQMALS